MTEAVVEEVAEAPETVSCEKCGKDGIKPNGLTMHWNIHCPMNPDRTKPPVGAIEGKVRRKSRRGLDRHGLTGAPVPAIQQIPRHSGGSWAYYLNPDGATIVEALSVYPNGGGAGSRFGRNASYYQERMRKRGRIFLGSKLTADGVRQLVETIAANKEDYALFLREEIEQCDLGLKPDSALSQAERDQARKRRGQLSGQLRLAEMDLDAAALTKELNEIAQAQALAESFTPQQLAVMKNMIADTAQQAVYDVATTFAEKRQQPASETQEPSRSNHIDATEGF